MFLTATNLIHYLCDVGLASTDDVTHECFTVSEIGRRNRNFRVARECGRSLFVKQVPAILAETTLSFMREAACAQLAAESDEVPALRAVMPRLLRYDPERHVLAYEAIDDAQSLAEHVARNGLADEVFDALAATLAAIHTQTRGEEQLASMHHAFAGEAPWICTIGEKAELVMPNMSGGCREIVRYMRATPELLHGLLQLGAQWRTPCLAHGDMKWDNVMIATLADGTKSVRLIDWELANRGDPLWDVCGILCAFFQYWLLQPAADLAAVGSPLFVGMRRSALRFWQRYAQAASDASAALPLHLGHLFGARLALLAFELLANATQMSPLAQKALECARYCFADPRRALDDLLGIEASTAYAARATSATPWRIEVPRIAA